MAALDQLDAIPDSGCVFFGKAGCGRSPGRIGPKDAFASESRGSGRKQPRRRWFLAAFMLFLMVAMFPAAASWIEVSVEAKDENEATVVGLEKALVQLAGFHSSAIADLVSELLRADHSPWLRSLERRGADGFLLAFDRSRLRTALETSKVPVWVGSRPALLVWAVMERGERRLLLGSGMDEDGVLDALRHFASRRDLPLLFPLGDLQDRRQVHTADVIGGLVEALAEPSRRYEPDGLVLLHLVPRGDMYRARAHVAYRNQVIQFEALAALPDVAAGEALAGAIDALGARLARVVAGDEALLLGFVDIETMAELQRLRARLSGLQAIREVRLNRLLPGAAVLDLRTGLDASSLAEVLQGEGFDTVVRYQDPDDVRQWFRAPR